MRATMESYSSNSTVTEDMDGSLSMSSGTMTMPVGLP